MKSIISSVLSLLLLLIISTRVSAQSIVLSLDAAQAEVGSEAVVRINMTNDVVVGALSFKVVLPQELTFVETRPSSIFSKTYRLPNSSSLSASRRSDHEAGLVFYDPDGINGEGISLGTGSILSFRVKVADNAAIGDYKISLEDLSASSLSGDSYDANISAGATQFSVLKKVVYYSVSTSSSTEGTISVAPYSYDNRYAEGTNVTVTATPSDGYEFISWYDGNTENPRSFSISEDMFFSATYAAKKYHVSFVADGNIVHEEDVVYGKEIPTIDGPAKEGYIFKGWSGLPDSNIMPARDLTITAEYVEIGKFSVSVASAHGSISITPESEGNVYLDGTTVTISATPDDGYEFTGWSDGSKSNPYTVTLTKNLKLTANYKAKTYVVSYYDDGVLVGTQEVACDSPIPAFDGPEKEGHTFAGWVGEKYSVMPAKNIEYSTKYTVNSYSISYFYDDVLVYQTNVFFGEPIPSYEYTIEGYIFKSWMGHKYDTMPAKDIEYFAILEPDAVKDIVAKDKVSAIYTITGTCVKRNVTAEDIKSLPTGLYIINGKKVVIR